MAIGRRDYPKFCNRTLDHPYIAVHWVEDFVALVINGGRRGALVGPDIEAVVVPAFASGFNRLPIPKIIVQLSDQVFEPPRIKIFEMDWICCPSWRRFAHSQRQ